MEYIKEINITEAVIHILDKNADEPIINKFCLELNDDIYSFLIKHIQKALGREDLRYAIFNKNRNNVKEVSQAYLNGESKLGEVSEEIAKQMFLQIKANSNIPSCDLIIVSMATEFGVMLGILKLDYIKNYKHKIDFINDQVGINIIPEFTGLPSGTNIKKCAFIKPTREENIFDLMIIDETATKDNDEEYGTNWFKNFLGCEVIENERDLTKNLLQVTEKFVRGNYRENAEKAEIVRSTLRENILKNKSVELSKFAVDLFNGQDGAVKIFKEYALAEGIEETIIVDKDFLEKKLTKHKIKINKDIELSISAESYSDLSKF